MSRKSLKCEIGPYRTSFLSSFTVCAILHVSFIPLFNLQSDLKINNFENYALANRKYNPQFVKLSQHLITQNTKFDRKRIINA